jgi:hypothetical protein
MPTPLPSSSRSARRAPTFLAVLVLGAAAGVAVVSVGCSKEPGPVVVADSSGDRVGELERRIRELENQNSEARQAASAANLSGSTLGQQMIQLYARIKKLEDDLAAAKAAAGNASAAMTDASGGSTTPPVASGGTLLVPPTDGGSFSDDQISTFRKLSDEVERRKNLEQQAERVRREIARAKITLTPAQEEAVIKLQASYNDKMRELFRGNGFGTSEDEREQSRAKVETIRTQFETDLHAIVPGSEGDRLAESMRRSFPGLFPRRVDGTRGGMRNAAGD